MSCKIKRLCKIGSIDTGSSGSIADSQHMDSYERSKKGTHSRFARNTGRDHDDVSTLESLGKAVVRREVALDLGRCRDVRDVCSDTWSVDDIEQAQLDGHSKY